MRDYEAAALAYRELIDRLESEKAPPETLRTSQQKCTEALVFAGGFVDSLEVWDRMAQDHPDSKEEALRMSARAKRMMLQQGDELLALAEEDLAAGHRAKAQATFTATQVLYQKGGADKARLEMLQKKSKKFSDPPLDKLSTGGKP